MSSVLVCDFDGKVIADGTPYVSMMYVKDHRAYGTVVEVQPIMVTFHDGMCAAGWLGQLGIGAPG